MIVVVQLIFFDLYATKFTTHYLLFTVVLVPDLKAGVRMQLQVDFTHARTSSAHTQRSAGPTRQRHPTNRPNRRQIMPRRQAKENKRRIYMFACVHPPMPRRSIRYIIPFLSQGVFGSPLKKKKSLEQGFIFLREGPLPQTPLNNYSLRPIETKLVPDMTHFNITILDIHMSDSLYQNILFMGRGSTLSVPQYINLGPDGMHSNIMNLDR